jgi:glycerophosphoryl diester phosphodiesterase
METRRPQIFRHREPGPLDRLAAAALCMASPLSTISCGATLASATPVAAPVTSTAASESQGASAPPIPTSTVGAAAGPRAEVEGHRGARGLRPENTMPSFELAIALGVDTIELDLHLSADDVLIVWHDPVLVPEKCDVTPDSADPQRWRVRGMTAAELRAIRCDRNPDPSRFPDQIAPPDASFHIPTLDEALALAAARPELKFNLELKRDPEDPTTIADDFDGEHPARFERGLVDAIHRHDLSERVVVQSFDHRSLWAVHQLDPQLTLAALTSREVPDLEVLAEQGARIWSPNHEDATTEAIERAHAAGLRVIPWTVNDPDDVARMLEAGADGIISDRPDIVIELIRARQGT